jgi:hypothetical protein
MFEHCGEVGEYAADKFFRHSFFKTFGSEFYIMRPIGLLD